MSTALAIQQYCDYTSKVLRFANGTVTTTQSVLTKFFLDIDREYNQVTIVELDAACAALLVRQPKPLMPSSVNNVRRTLRGFYKWCDEYQEDDLELNFRLIREIKEPQKKLRYPSPEEVALVIQNCDDPMNKLIIAMLYETGLRISELTNLTVGDIDLTNNQILVKGKGDKEREAYFSDQLAVLIRKFYRENDVYKGRIFTHDGLCYRSKALRGRVKKEFAAHDFLVTPHNLRHTFATSLYRNGADIKIIKELLGHTRLDITDRYLHLTNRDLQLSREKHLPSFAY